MCGVLAVKSILHASTLKLSSAGMSDEIVGSRSAAKIAGVSHATICNWCERYGIGEMRDGRWFVSLAGLNRIMSARAVLCAS